MKYFRKFNTIEEYNNASLDLPGVSMTTNDREIYYNPYSPPTYPISRLTDRDLITQYILDYFTDKEGITLIIDTPLYHLVFEEDNVDQWCMTAHDEQDDLSRFEIYYEPSDGSIAFYNI